MRKQILIVIAALLVVVVGGKTQAKELPFRAAWVSTVYNLDYPSKAALDEQTLRAEAQQIIQTAKKMGLTALILQVRPCSDAFYPSDIFPWSRYLTGSQGTPPENGFDPLAYWVQETHAAGLELHAWINPYRITTGKTAEWENLAAEHPARRNPDWAVEYQENYYWNPGLPQVRQMVIDGALEIVNRYNVDGIHLDDYFYPGQAFQDSETYAAYGGAFDDLGDWRRENVNQLIHALDTELHKADPNIRFGVSPAGIWANQNSISIGSATGGKQSYFANYADSRTWVKEGWVDYICPQIYWQIGHASADYETLARWWAETVQGTDVDLYIGMADYQAGNSDPTSPWYGIEALRRQHILNETLPEVKGEVHFRYGSLVEVSGLVAYYTKVYQMETLPPPALEREKHMAYMQGMQNGFEPYGHLTRAQAAMIFARLSVGQDGAALFDEGKTYETSFVDIDTTQWYAGAVGFMEQYGIINGFQDGSFRPTEPVSRAQLVAMATRFEGQLPSGSSRFPDVAEEYWAKDAICYAAQQGWISGYPEGTFLPEHPITRTEAVKVMNRLLRRAPDVQAIQQGTFSMPFGDVPQNFWGYAEIMEAAVAHQYEKKGEAETWTEIVQGT